MLVAGLSVLLYPTISNYMQSVKHRQAIYSYLETVETLSDDEYESILNSAKEYNERLAQKKMSLMRMTDEQRIEYEKLLDITGTSIMGYIDINKVGIHLPIYHGTSEAVLQDGVGHIEGSSLPVGGETSHCILSAHRGLPSAKLFTNLDKMELGDTFVIIVLNEAYVYKVDDIKVIKPTELGMLSMTQGEDYCTLMTCTPYGVNTHRLLVRGKRMAVTTAEERMSVQAGAKFVDMWFILAVVDIPVLIISVIISASAVRRRYRNTKL